jgi:hypothetical protein
MPHLTIAPKSGFFTTVITLMRGPAFILTVVGFVACVVIIHALIVIRAEPRILPILVVLLLINLLFALK